MTLTGDMYDDDGVPAGGLSSDGPTAGMEFGDSTRTDGSMSISCTKRAEMLAVLFES